jgi:hypothetical protein
VSQLRLAGGVSLIVDAREVRFDGVRGYAKTVRNLRRCMAISQEQGHAALSRCKPKQHLEGILSRANTLRWIVDESDRAHKANCIE